MANDRRDFLKKAGLAASGVILGSATNISKSSEDDKEEKVIVKKQLQVLSFRLQIT